MELLSQLISDPKLWSVLTPAGILVIVLGYALYKMFIRYDKLQEVRISEWKQVKDEYNQLATEINKTLDLLIKLSSKRNGGNNGQ